MLLSNDNTLVYCRSQGKGIWQTFIHVGVLYVIVVDRKESIRTAVRGMKPNGVDVVFESVGGDAFKDCFRWLVHFCLKIGEFSSIINCFSALSELYFCFDRHFCLFASNMADLVVYYVPMSRFIFLVLEWTAGC